MSHPQLDSLLSALANHDGSDLHVKGEAIPRIRVDGDLRRLDVEPLTPSTVSEMAAAIMRADTADHFERTGSGILQPEAGLGQLSDLAAAGACGEGHVALSDPREHDAAVIRVNDRVGVES